MADRTCAVENMEMRIAMLEFYRGKKVFLTGHTGFKGTWLTKLLLLAGANVTGYSLMPPEKNTLFDLSGVEGQINSLIGDIRDRDSLLRAFQTSKPELVFHLAAQPIVRDSYKDPAYTYAVLAEKLGLSRKTISSRIKSLKDKGVLQRVGSDTKGHWQIKNGK